MVTKWQQFKVATRMATEKWKQPTTGGKNKKGNWWCHRQQHLRWQQE